MTDLKLDEPGLLPKPGPVGRIVRLLFGLLCLWYVNGLIMAAGSLVARLKVFSWEQTVVASGRNQPSTW